MKSGLIKKNELKLWLAIIFVIFFLLFNIQETKNNPKSSNNITESNEKVSIILESKKDELVADIEQEKSAEIFTEKGLERLEKILISVPFLSQAPFQVWDALHEDACEEASFLMVRHFLDSSKINSLADEDKEIKKMITYEEKNGFGMSITMDELNQIAKDHYKIDSGRVKKDIVINDIKNELINGRPVIVPAAGKVLPNPNFKNGGPNYHMLVVIGFDEQGFITNDPGTRKGQNFRYTFQGLFSAIHDWDPKNILNGQKAYLIFE
jgi:hypothetical protein